MCQLFEFIGMNNAAECEKLGPRDFRHRDIAFVQTAPDFCSDLSLTG